MIDGSFATLEGGEDGPAQAIDERARAPNTEGMGPGGAREAPMADPTAHEETEHERIEREYVELLEEICIALATALLLAPTAYHRIRFQAGDKPWITRRGTVLVLAAMVAMVPGISGTLFVVTDVTFSRVAALLVGGGMAVFLVVLWFMVPLLRRR